MEIIRGRLSTKDFSPQNLRYNSDTDMIEFTPDGGTTWNPDPADDPRHSPKFAKVLKTGSTVQCDSAASMVEWIKQFIDYETSLMVAGAEITGLANAVLVFFDLLAPWAILINGLIDLAGTIFGVGAAALTTAFTEETYDLLQCCFFCNIHADGTVTIDDLAAIQAQVTTDLNTTAALIVNAILTTQGEMGVQNAGTLYDVAGDCDDCNCQWAYRWNFRDGERGWTLPPDGTTTGTWTDGEGWLGVYNGSANACGLIFESSVWSPAFDVPSDCVIEVLTFGVSHIQTGCDNYVEMWVGANRTEGLGRSLKYVNSSWEETQSAEGEIDGALSSQHFTIGLAPHFGMYTRFAEIKGTGTPPDFTGGEFV